MLTEKEQLVKEFLIAIDTGKPKDFTIYIDRESAMLFVDNMDKNIVEELVVHSDLQETVMVSVDGEGTSFNVYVENINIKDRDGNIVAVEHEIPKAFICEDLSELEYIKVLFRTQRHQADTIYLIDC